MTNVFRLKGVDVCRVLRCEMLPCDFPEARPARSVDIEKVEECSRRVVAATDMEELFRTTLEACEELLGVHHAFVMLLDETGERLYTVASIGYASSGAGSEVRVGEGLIGVAAARRQSVRVTRLSRDLSYSHVASEGAQGGGSRAKMEQVIPLPGLASAESQLVTPMLAFRRLAGVICLQSEKPGAFRAADECVVGILANQVAMAMANLDAPEPPAAETAVAGAPTTDRPVQVKHYSEDDSVFFDNEYLIKGVAGGILWRLLKNYQDEGRVEFSNKEIRLDQTLDLPDIKDNLEARLILLRKRLEERSEHVRIEKVARGRFRLVVSRPLSLVSMEGGGPL
jgi:adenylate cyclase